MLNVPRGLREANEKLYALNFPEVIPESLVTSDIARLKDFLDELGGEMIVKPLDGAGGAGVLPRPSRRPQPERAARDVDARTARG